MIPGKSHQLKHFPLAVAKNNQKETGAIETKTTFASADGTNTPPKRRTDNFQTAQGRRLTAALLFRVVG
jgi:hypothetical protein